MSLLGNTMDHKRTRDASMQCELHSLYHWTQGIFPWIISLLDKTMNQKRIYCASIQYEVHNKHIFLNHVFIGQNNESKRTHYASCRLCATHNGLPRWLLRARHRAYHHIVTVIGKSSTSACDLQDKSTTRFIPRVYIQHVLRQDFVVRL